MTCDKLIYFWVTSWLVADLPPTLRTHLLFGLKIRCSKRSTFAAWRQHLFYGKQYQKTTRNCISTTISDKFRFWCCYPMFIPCDCLRGSRSGHGIHNPFVKCKFHYNCLIYVVLFTKMCVRNYTCDEQDYLLYLAYWLPIDCLLLALDAHMIRVASPWAAPWALGPGPGPYPWWLSVRASRASNRQSIGNIWQVILLITCYTFTTFLRTNQKFKKW